MTQDNQNCPGCGSSIPKSAIKCGYCGFEITKENLTGDKYILSLQQAINDIVNQKERWGGPQLVKEQKIASVISVFSLPNDKENLLELFHFCDNNADAYSDLRSFGNSQIMVNKILYPAWAGKAKMAYNKLKRFANDDEEIKALVEEYKNKYHVEAKDMKQASINKNQGTGKAVLFGLNQSGVILGVVLLLLCFPLCWLPLVMPQFKGE